MDAVKTIAFLQSKVSRQETEMLVSAFLQLEKKPMREMSNEEKTVRAVIMDELSSRGRMMNDFETGEYWLTDASLPEKGVRE